VLVKYIQRVLDPHPFYVDPDPGFEKIPDLDLGFEIFADPDADPGLDFSQILLFIFHEIM